MKLSVCRECIHTIHIEVLDDEWNKKLGDVNMTAYSAVDFGITILDKANKLLLKNKE